MNDNIINLTGGWLSKLQPGTIIPGSGNHTECYNRFAVYKGSPVWCVHPLEAHISPFPCDARVKNGTCPGMYKE
jgi:hypothetical protein